MKATYFLPLALATLASATPRIDQISPATGIINGTPIAFDLDLDGDLDIAYLNNGQIGTDTPETSTWLENLGNRQFSAPRSLGYRFSSSQTRSLAETLIQSSSDQSTTLLHLVVATPLISQQVYSKNIDSPSWNLIHTFPEGDSASFLQSPNPDLQLVFSKPLDSDQVTLWHATPHSLTIAGQITLPPTSNNGDNSPFNIQAADLDQDGDADLILQSQSQTLLYEQTSPFQFSDTPVPLDLTNAIIGDLNTDGLPDLFDSSSLRRSAINEGNFTFTESTFSGTFSNALTATLGTLGGLPTFFDLQAGQQDNRIEILQANPDFDNLDFATEIPFETNSINTSALLVADFDQDGQSDLTYLSRSTPIPQQIFTGITPFRDIILFINPVPTYDQVKISWGQTSSLSPPVPASDSAPITCESPAIGDFNNDGFLDLIVGPDINGQARILLNDGLGNFPTSRLLTELQPAEFQSGLFSLQNFAPVDLNGDGHLDLSLTVTRIESSFSPAEAQTACTIALGDGSGSFAPVSLPPGSFQTIANGFCRILEFQDFDNDGDPDAILQGAWRENVNGTLREGAFPLIQNAATTDALGNPSNIVSQQIIDLDLDGFPDVFIPAFTRVDNTPTDIVGAGDFFVDFLPALAFNNGLGALRDISEFQADLVVSDALGNPTVLPHLALDLDLDGLPEILTSESSTDALGNPTVLRINCLKLNPDSPRDLTLAQTVHYPTFTIPTTDRLLDFNGDGELEYVSADQFITPTIRGPLISPKYNFRGDHLQGTFPPLEPIAVHDFDNDGDIDALYATGFSGLHLVRNTLVDEDSPITDLLVAAGLTPALATPEADPDNDGRSNALELLQGTDFLTPDQAPSEFLFASLSPEGTHLQFTQRSDASDLALLYDLEISPDLVTWNRINTPEPAIESTEGIWSKVSVEIPRNTSRNYYRISATHDPRR